jgi:HlyD family secretion protein
MNQPSDTQSRNRKPLFIGVAVAASALILFMLFGASGEETDELDYHVVKKDSFLVTIVEGGTLEAVNQVSIRNEMKYSSKIVSIVPEGGYAKKGDLLCELDVSEIEDRLDEQKLTVESAEFALTQAQESLKIQESVNDSTIKAAQLKVEFAKTDLEKYKDGDWPQALRNATADILTAEEKMKIDEDTLEWSKKLHAQGYETRNTMERNGLTFTQSKVKMEQATEAKRLLQQYDNPKQVRQFEADLEEANADLERANQQADSRKAQSEAEVTSSTTKLELQRKKLKEFEDQISAAKIYAPEGGLIVYPFVSYRSQSQTMIEEGASVRSRQEIIILPDISHMKVGIKVHETHVNQVSHGMAAYVVLDSFPDERFKAHVRKVSTMPDQQSRFSNPDLKVYAAEILIDDKLPDVKPGLSARAEVIITNLLDVIKVPVQCVTSHQGKQVCYVQKSGGPEPVTVIVGMFNHKFIEVQEGLSPGDKILLSPPLDATTEGMEDTFVGEGEALPKGQTPAQIKADQQKIKQDSARKREGQDGGKGKGGFDRAAMMKRFDKDKDGKLSEAEQKAIRAAYSGGQKGGSKGGAKGGSKGGQKGERPRGQGGEQQGGGGKRGGGDR